MCFRNNDTNTDNNDTYTEGFISRAHQAYCNKTPDSNLFEHTIHVFVTTNIHQLNPLESTIESV